MQNYTTDSKDPKWIGLALALCGFVLVVFALLSAIQYLTVSYYGNSSPDAYSASGDFFGFANSVFSALAFAMIIITLWMQMHELKLQRQEIQDNREVLKNQKDEMEKQNASLAQSNFEGTFFSLLSRQNEILLGVRDKYYIRADKMELTGCPAFESFSRSIGELVQKRSKENDVEKFLPEWFNQRSSEIGRYFFNLIIILEMILKQPEDLRPLYTDILKAQLSPSEMHVLFWYGLFSAHGYRAKPHLEKLAFFEDVRLNKEAVKFKGHYTSSAFGAEDSRE